MDEGMREISEPADVRSVKHLDVISMGRSEYSYAWKLQNSLFEYRSLGRIDDVLLLTEHDHVYTSGKSGNGNHLLADPARLERLKAKVFEVDRGGDITYHGPGQLVGYPILDLGGYYRDLHRYLRDIEEVIIRSLSSFGIQGSRDNQFTGVWVATDKIAAIGVKASRWITMHGFALNVNTDLSYFDHIIPCGIFHKGVTSMKRILGADISMEDVQSAVVQNFELVFKVDSSRASLADLLRMEHSRTQRGTACPLPEESLSRHI